MGEQRAHQNETRDPKLRFRLIQLLSNRQFRAHPLITIWKRLRWRIHWALWPARPFVVKYRGTGIQLALMHSSVSAGCYYNQERCSDPLVAELFEGYLKPGMVVIDCGAHIGEYTVYFSHLVGTRGHVYAFEPDPRAFSQLERNLELNQVSNVTLNKSAVHESDGVETFVIRRDAAGSSLEIVDASLSTRTIACRTTSLNTYVRENAFERLDALKIDVEGSEVAVLRGAREVIGRFRPGLMVLDCHSNSWQVGEITNLLAEFGYAVDHVSPERKCIQVIVRLKQESSSLRDLGTSQTLRHQQNAV